MPGAEKVRLEVELVEKNAEQRLKALDKLAKEFANKKISLKFDEASLAKWKAATEGMTNAEIAAFAKMASAAENANAKIAAAAEKASAKVITDEMKTNAKIMADRQKSFDKKVELYEKEDTKRRAIAAKTEQAELNAAAKTQAAAEKGAKATKQQTKAQKELNTEAEKTSSIFAGITQRFTAANLISSLITTGISKLRQAIRGAVSDLKEMDKELTTIKMVTGASDSYIDQLTSQAFAGARGSGRSVTDYLTAAERFARAGYREDIDALSKLSLMTQNIGGVEEDTAAKFLLAADAAWKLNGSYDSLMEVLDGVSAVADQNATDLSKIAEGITVAGSAFANAGESAATFTAMLGTTTASTQRSGSEMARGLRMILFRVRQVKAEFDDGEIVDEKAISNAAKALKDVGISVLDETGDLRSLSDILGELAGKWGKLSKAQQSYLQNYLAGNRNGNVLYALMDNWGEYEKMLSQYEDSAGTALEKNAKYTDSWAASTANLKTSWAELIGVITDNGGAIQAFVDGLAKAIGGLAEDIRPFSDALGYVAANKDKLKDTFSELLGTGDMPGIKVETRFGRFIKFLGKAIDFLMPNATEAIEENENAIVDHSEAVETDADAVEELSNAFSNAGERIKALSSAMKSERDDAIKSVADIYKAMKQAEEKGYYGSNAYREGSKFFFGTSDRSKINQRDKDALGTYFEEMANGDYSNSAAKFFKTITDGTNQIQASNGEVLASVVDIGDAYQWTFDKGNRSMDDYLASLELNTGISKDFWASMIESLGMYSDELADWADENGEVKTEAEFEDEKAKSEAEKYIELLNSVPPYVQTIVSTVYKSSGSVESAENAARTALAQGASSTSHTWSGAQGAPLSAFYPHKAGGKMDSYSGPAIVNDEYPANGSKPELIISKSAGRAYIANGGRPALVNLRSDDMVLTASQTRSALGVPRFETGKGLVGGLFGGAISSFAQTVKEKAKEAVSTVVTAVTPKTPTKKKTGSGGGGGSGSSKEDTAQDNWEALKKLIDYLLEKGQEDLKEQLKVLDEQLEELEAARKAQQESKELEERQLAVQTALEDLQKAQVERTVRYYNEETQQWEWMADQGAVQSAQEAYDQALQDLNDFLDEQEYERQVEAIQAQKESLQAQFDAYKESWEAIVDAIEAPSGDIKALLAAITGSGTSTMQAQSGSIAQLLNDLRSGLVSAGYLSGLSNINDNTKGSKTTKKTVFDSGGFAIGTGIMRKGSVGPETVIGPDITSAILDPVKNDRFTSFVDSLRYLVGDSSSPSFGRGSSITNNNGGNYYVNGVQVGADMAQRPFAEVMRTIAIHANETA